MKRRSFKTDSRPPEATAYQYLYHVAYITAIDTKMIYGNIAIYRSDPIDSTDAVHNLREIIAPHVPTSDPASICILNFVLLKYDPHGVPVLDSPHGTNGPLIFT